MRFINNKIHGVIDYVAAVALIGVPFLAGFEAIDPVAHWLSIAAGASLILYSLVTGYSYGAFGLISFGFHLALDFAVGLVFLAAPFFFGFDGIPRAFFLVSGVAVIVLVFITNPQIETVSPEPPDSETAA